MGQRIRNILLALIPFALYQFIPNNKKAALQSLLPLAISSIIFMTCRIAVIGTGLIAESKSFLENPFLQLRGERLVEMIPAEKYGTIFFTLLKYLQLHLIAYPLTHDYAPKSIDTYSLFSIFPLIAVLLYAVLIYLAFKWFKSKPIYSWSIIVFIIALLPTSNFFFSSGSSNSPNRSIFSTNLPNLLLVLSEALLVWSI